MPGEVRIHVDVDAPGLRFQVRSGTREITTGVDPDLAASFYEDLRLLRWKSAGVHDPGDTLLNHVGERLAALIAPPETWEELRLPVGALRVRVQFTRSARPASSRAAPPGGFEPNVDLGRCILKGLFVLDYIWDNIARASRVIDHLDT
jgi:hypothetical protein